MNGSSAGVFRHSHPSTDLPDLKIFPFDDAVSSDQKLSNLDDAVSSCSDADEFPRSLAKTAVAQICEAAGFRSAHLSALDALADIAIRFLCDAGKASQYYANLSGRTQSSALDVLCAVDDINGGGRRAATATDTPSKLKQFVDNAQEIPFCKTVPRFPVIKKHASIPSFAQVQEKPPGAHIPEWLPAFPDVHTYKATPVWNERRIDPRLDKLQQAKQRKKAVQSLVSLHSRLSAIAASENASDAKAEQDMKLWGAPSPSSLDINKEGPTSVRSSSPPDSISVGAHVPCVVPSIFEIFAPALREATCTVHESNGAGSSRMGYLSSQKTAPSILTFDFGRKAGQTALVARLSIGGKEAKRGLSDLKDDEKDDKKKRAYQILKQSLPGRDMPSNEQRH